LAKREAPGWSLDKLNAYPEKRYFKSHARYRHLPKGNADIRVIYLARNPFDTAVSLYYHAINKPEFEFSGNFTEFCQLFLSGQVENGLWIDHVAEWYNKSIEHPDNILFFKYEDLHDNTAEIVQKIAQFIGFEYLSEELLEKVLMQSSFEEMKKNNPIGMNHIRTGVYGGWRNYFDAELEASFRKVSVLQLIYTSIPLVLGPEK
jgi:hypothetical protein